MHLLINFTQCDPSTIVYDDTGSGNSSAETLITSPTDAEPPSSTLPSPTTAQTAVPTPHAARFYQSPAEAAAELARKRASGEMRRACSSRGAIKAPPGRVNTTQRVLALRKIMRQEIVLQDGQIDAYYVTTDDDHQTDYVAPYDRRLEFLSGFSGSYGEVLVTLTKAVLWTDGRYHLQADDQLNCEWLLMREGESKIPTKSEWLRNELSPGARIGADPRLISASAWQDLERELRAYGLNLVELTINLVDVIWTNHQDTITDKNAFLWDIKYAGQNWTSKVDETRGELSKVGADALVVTSLPEIAWLLNIRGRDVPYHFYLKSYAIITRDHVFLYTNKTKLHKNNIQRALNSNYGYHPHAVTIMHYEDVWADLPTRLQAWRSVIVPGVCVFSRGASRAIYKLVPAVKRLVLPSPIIALMATKNPVEIAGMERAQIRDAAVMCLFLSYFEKWFDQTDSYTELDVVRELDAFRYEQKNSFGNSFPTVAAFGTNAAQPNYEPSPSTNVQIFANSTLVIDSGGQYLEGTTVVTRTIHMGTPNVRQINAYTRVLMGAIQLSRLVFPANMRMSVADVMARAPLWEVGLDYMHTTGTGIGTFLGVRESPISVNYNNKEGQDYTFKPGYFFSNEPGYYQEFDFGVRLENVLKVVEKPWLQHISGQQFFGLLDVTLVPYEPKLINVSLLSPDHIRWLNAYNTRIRELVGKELKEQNKMEGFYWMMEKTKYIPGAATLVFNRFASSLILILCSVILVIF